MSIFILKSILSVVLVVSALASMFTMFEIFGREMHSYDIDTLKKVHRINGISYILLFAVIAYFCLSYINSTGAELSPRAALHSMIAIFTPSILFVKILFVKKYRKFYEQAKVLGIIVVLLTFVMAGMSGGYYLVAGRTSLERPKISEEELKVELRTDQESIERGKDLYESKCFLCHDPYSNETITGPGHKGILKNPFLPVSGKASTPENVANQLRNPYDQMPSFIYLTADERNDIIAFLNTL